MRGPTLTTTLTAAYLAASAMELAARWTKKPPASTRAEAKALGRYYWYRSDRARALGYRPRSSRRALAQADRLAPREPAPFACDAGTAPPECRGDRNRLDRVASDRRRLEREDVPHPGGRAPGPCMPCGRLCATGSTSSFPSSATSRASPWTRAGKILTARCTWSTCGGPRQTCRCCCARGQARDVGLDRHGGVEARRLGLPLADWPQVFADRVDCVGVTRYEEAMGGRGTRIVLEGELDVATGKLPGVSRR